MAEKKAKWAQIALFSSKSNLKARVRNNIQYQSLQEKLTTNSEDYHILTSLKSQDELMRWISTSMKMIPQSAEKKPLVATACK